MIGCSITYPICYLITQQLKEDFRDLQKISIYYNSFLRFEEDLKKMLIEKNVFQFTKNQFEKYISINELNLQNNDFSEDKKAEDMIDYLKDSVDKAKAKVYFEELEGKKIPAFKINIKIHNLLQDFVISGGFELPKIPTDPK